MPSRLIIALVVQHTGGVQTLFEIAGPDAPITYRFDNAIPDEHTGTIKDTTGTTTGTIAAPWAFDATGSNIPTHCTIDGTTLTQTVDHQNTGFAYPITADPWWNPFSWNWNRIWDVMARRNG